MRIFLIILLFCFNLVGCNEETIKKAESGEPLKIEVEVTHKVLPSRKSRVTAGSLKNKDYSKVQENLEKSTEKLRKRFEAN